MSNHNATSTAFPAQTPRLDPEALVATASRLAREPYEIKRVLMRGLYRDVLYPVDADSPAARYLLGDDARGLFIAQWSLPGTALTAWDTFGDIDHLMTRSFAQLADEAAAPLPFEVA